MSYSGTGLISRRLLYKGWTILLWIFTYGIFPSLVFAEPVSSAGVLRFDEYEPMAEAEKIYRFSCKISGVTMKVSLTSVRDSINYRTIRKKRYSSTERI